MSMASPPDATVAVELSLLASLSVLPTAFSEVRDILMPAMFSDPRCAKAYGGMASLIAAGKPIDLVLLRPYLEPLNLEWIDSWWSSEPSGANARFYAERIAENYGKRKLAVAADRLGAQARNGEALASAISQAERELSGLRQLAEIRKSAEPIGSAVRREFNRIGNDPKGGGVRTGLAALDAILLPMRPGQMIILAGRTGMGKSSLALTISLNVAAAGLPVLYFTLETDADEMARAAISSRSKLTERKIVNGPLADAEMDAVIAAAAELDALPFAVDDCPVLTPASLVARIRLARPQPRVVVVDQLSVMREPGYRSRYEEMTSISRGVKIAAKTCGVPIIACHQINREPEHRKDHRPTMADLRDSGGLEQDADAVLLIYRPDYYDRSASPGAAEIIVDKQRRGPRSTAHLRFERTWGRFVNTEDAQ